ncbi:MAG: TlpA disulfide reductase family protein [Sulfuricella sp.]
MIGRILLVMLLTAMLALPAGAGTLDRELAKAAGMEAYPVPLKAAAFELPALTGEARAKAHYRGKVVLLNFWASWCPPCREEFPSLERLQQALGGKDFTVLAVSVRDSEDGIARFLGGRAPPFDVLLDTEGKTAQNYRAMGVPVTYLLDREGRMLAGKTGPQAWDSAEMQRLIRTAIEKAQ